MKRHTGLYVVVLAFFSAAALGQSFRGTILGTVRDASGAVLPGVTITVTDQGTNVRRTAVTNETGDFVMPELAVATYSLTAELPGFKKEVLSGLDLSVDQRLRANVRMEIGNIAETVEVRAETPLIASDSATVGTVIDNRKVVELPLNGRQFLQLNLLVPGAVPGTFGSQLSTQGGAISVNGMREAGNNFLLDGVDNNDLAINLFSVSPSVDSIQEFKLQSSTYSAEYGKQAGAQINVTTKSGTNSIHGTLFEFIRNDNLDAKNFFDKPSAPTPEFKRNQFGGSIGGPIAKDKTFWFANYDGTRIRKGITRTALIPTLLERAGDFSQTPGLTLRDPLTGQPFAGNRIPPNRIDPVGAKIAGMYPNPNVTNPAQNFVSSPIMRRRIDQVTGRVDHRFGNNDQIFGRYTLNDDPRFDTFEPFSRVTDIPGYGAFTENRQQVAGIGWTHIFSPKFFSEVRLGYNRFKGAILQENINKDISTQLGIRNVSTVPDDFGWPLFSMTGYSNIGEATNLPQNRRDNTYEVKDILSYTTGRHAIKGGIELREFQNYILFDTVARGTLTFNGSFSNNAIGDLLLGIPFNAQLNVPDGGLTASNVIYQRFFSVGWFLQDDWKVSPKLTLNLGLRYGANQPIKEKRNRLSKFSLEQGKLVVAGRDGQAETLYDWDKNNFAPRFGFAWTPVGSRTVLRGGYGVFYDTKLTNNFTGMSLNTPFRTLYVFQNAAGQAPAFVLNGLFPSNLSTAPAATLAVNGVQQKFPDGYSQQWSFNVQREIGNSLMVELGYVGSKGTKLDRGYNPNQPPAGPGNAAQIQARRPFPQYSAMTYRIAEASSIYHSGQVRVEKRYSQGISFLASYTWSKAIDNASLWNAGAQNSFDLRGERGPSNFDLRHRMSYSYTWDLPFGREGGRLKNLSPVADAFLGGWQFSGIVSLQTGQPITPGAPGDRANIGAGGQRPNAIANPNLPRSQRDPSRWFNPAAYTLAELYTFGNAARNSIEGPGVNNFDLSLSKNFKVRERGRIQFRTEFFNAFNHPNFDPPNGVATTVLTAAGAPAPSAGVVNSAKDSRQLQFGLKVYY
jgi:hypothetical protein